MGFCQTPGDQLVLVRRPKASSPRRGSARRGNAGGRGTTLTESIRPSSHSSSDGEVMVKLPVVQNDGRIAGSGIASTENELFGPVRETIYPTARRFVVSSIVSLG